MAKLDIDPKKLDEIIKKLKGININTENCGGCLEDLNLYIDNKPDNQKVRGWKRTKNKK